MNFSTIKLLILDVDGVLTDGRVSPGSSGPATAAEDSDKRFHVRDGAAIKLWQRAGHQVAILSGRRSEAVSARAKELGIEVVRMGESDKAAAFDEICTQLGVAADEIAYVGDDLPDLGPMMRCRLAVSVGDAAAAVKRASHFVTRRIGGSGAVAEAIEWILRKQNRWSAERLTTV